MHTLAPDCNWGQARKTKVWRGESRGAENTERERQSQRAYAPPACSSLFSQKGALFIHLKELGKALSSPSRSPLVSISNCLFSHPVSVSFSCLYESFVRSLFSSPFCFTLLLLYSWRLIWLPSHTWKCPVSQEHKQHPWTMYKHLYLWVCHRQSSGKYNHPVITDVTCFYHHDIVIILLLQSFIRLYLIKMYLYMNAFASLCRRVPSHHSECQVESSWRSARVGTKEWPVEQGHFQGCFPQSEPGLVDLKYTHLLYRPGTYAHAHAHRHKGEYGDANVRIKS